MKRIKHLNKTMLLLFVVLGFTACKKGIQDIDKVQEQMELSASAPSIVLDDSRLQSNIITFNWKKARPQSDDHLVSYVTKLDIVGNNFGSSTSIMNYEDDNVVSRSFTSEQLQNWAYQKWGVAVNKSFTLEFRVVAQWEGGATYEMPEVRTVRVNVTPIKTVVFDADKVFLNGSALGLGTVEMTKTLENPNQYAILVNLQAGDLQIPTQYNGETNYIGPTDVTGALSDGDAVPVKMKETAVPWKIVTPGQYRIIVNMQKATVTIYSPAKALLPKSVVWNATAGSITTTISDLWMHGAINSFGTPIKMECNVSLADPQILVYTGGKTGKTKFIVYGGTDNDKNLAYAFSCPLTSTSTAQELTLTLGTVATLSGGSTSAQRNSYYTIPAGTNFLTLDLRNMTILAEKR